jgi:hypothetical protein
MEKKELNKEAKQRLVLIILSAVLVVGGLHMYLLGPMLERYGKARQTIRDLEPKVTTARQQVATAERVLPVLKEMTVELVKLSDEDLPLAGNEYAWAARQVYNAGGAIGRNDLEVKESGRTSSANRMAAKVGNGPYFQAYTTRVTFQGGFFEAQELIRLLEASNPYATVGRFTLQAGTNPERHAVDLFLQWPVLEKPEDLKRQREMAEL